MEKILIIEDDKRISRILQIELQHYGYLVELAYTGAEGLERAKKEHYSLILLDLMLPEMDGERVCEEIRRVSEVPIIVTTAKDKVLSKVNLLDLGADDYLTKPFEMEELYARMRVAMRNKKSYREEEFLIFEDIRIVPKKAQVFKGEEEVVLTKREYDLLEYLVTNKGLILTREKILNKVWGYDYDGVEKVVDVYIKALREKVDRERCLIHAVRGRGYVIKKKPETL